MCRRRAIIALALFLFAYAASGGFATAQGTSEQATLEAEELGVSLARIKHKLERLPDDMEARNLLRLNYYIQVYARTPPLDYFEGFDLHNSPVPSGPPTHDQLLAVMRSGEPQLTGPVINLGNVIGWANSR
jgi:hypothetical protein